MLDLFLPKIKRLHGPTVDSRLTPQEQARKEKERAQSAKYYARNRERLLAGMRARYQARKEEYRAKSKAWDAANPEKRRAIRRRSEAIHRNARLRLEVKA